MPRIGSDSTHSLRLFSTQPRAKRNAGALSLDNHMILLFITAVAISTVFTSYYATREKVSNFHLASAYTAIPAKIVGY
jgi:hypothetical protein